MPDRYEVVTMPMHTHAYCADCYGSPCDTCGEEVTDDPRWVKIAVGSEICRGCLIKSAYNAGRRAAFEDLATGTGHAHFELADAATRITAQRRIAEYAEFLVTEGDLVT